MTVMTLFGLSLAPLYAAIAQVESDRGATSSNIYQIRDIYIKDVNRILLERGYGLYAPFEVRAKFCRMHSESMMHVYWLYYGRRYERETGLPVTYEVLARIHNGGPRGWEKASTVGYWHRVERVLRKIEREGGAE